MKDQIEDEETNKLNPWIALGLVFIIFIFWFVTPSVVNFAFDHNWIENLDDKHGQFGDMFGSVNALFSGLALAGVVVAILLQSKELSLQRAELRKTRLHLENTADAQQASKDEFEKQVSLMRITSRVNSLSAVLTAYINQIEIYTVETRNATSARKKLLGDANIAKKERDKVVKQLNEVLHELDEF